ncbi:hypothetical protein HZS_2767, partial [Henneguya salminicola]
MLTYALSVVDSSMYFKTVKMSTRDDYEYDPKKKYCSVSLYLDPDFVASFLSRDEAFITAVGAFNFINLHFSNVEVNGVRGVISYYVSKISIISETDRKVYLRKIDPSEHLDSFNQYLENTNDKSCLSVFLTAFNYDGTLGMAYVGTHRGIGICGRKSGILVTRVPQNFISTPNLYHTIYHELYHTLGSRHDPSKPCETQDEDCPNGVGDSVCVGDSMNGRYIMYTHSALLGSYNSNKPSKCTIQYIELINQSEERTNCLTCKITKSIFLVNPETLCGNTIIEGDEECDSGPFEDDCCDKNCFYLLFYICPANGKCCNEECEIIQKNHRCKDLTDCHEPSFCNSSDPSYYCTVACLDNNNICQPLMVYSSYRRKNFGKTFFFIIESPCNDDKGFCLEDGICYSLKPDDDTSEFIYDLISGHFYNKLVDYLMIHFLKSLIILGVSLIVFFDPKFVHAQIEFLFNDNIIHLLRPLSLHAMALEEDKRSGVKRNFSGLSKYETIGIKYMTQ